MQCPFCHGGGVRLNPARVEIFGECTALNVDNEPLLVPCDACGGQGVTSCCEGMVGGPDEPTN